jgi:SAM-dependent methyltransferase
MSGQDRVHWDAVYRDRYGYPNPDPLLFPYVPPVIAEDGAPHRALDLAGGLGQNALWLAEQGYQVDLIDISRVALVRAQREAAVRGLRGVNFIQADLDQHPLEPESYTLVCVFRFLNRALFPALRAAVRPGGRVLYETFNRRRLASAPNFNPDYTLDIGELGGVFADWHILRLNETGDVSQVVAIKRG